MLETIAMSLLIIWALGLVAGVSLGGAIHVLLLASGVALWIERSSRWRARSQSALACERAMLPWRREEGLKTSVLQASRRGAASSDTKAMMPPAPPGGVARGQVG